MLTGSDSSSNTEGIRLQRAFHAPDIRLPRLPRLPWLTYRPRKQRTDYSMLTKHQSLNRFVKHRLYTTLSSYYHAALHMANMLHCTGYATVLNAICHADEGVVPQHFWAGETALGIAYLSSFDRNPKNPRLASWSNELSCFTWKTREKVSSGVLVRPNGWLYISYPSLDFAQMLMNT